MTDLDPSSIIEDAGPVAPRDSPAQGKSCWHALDVADALVRLGSDRGGLTSMEATRRLAEHGRNELIERAGRGPLHMLWEQLTAVMVLILIGAAVLSLLLGKLAEAGAIGTIVVLFAVLGFVQEYRAERAIAALRRLAVPTVRVQRDGHVSEIVALDLVPGDLVLLEAGNVVPADLRLVESAGLRIQEAALTGESEPVDKRVEAISRANEIPLGDRMNMAYAGTQVTYGRGRGLVVATGMGTELGAIATLLQGVGSSQTPLQQRLDEVGKQLALVGLAVAAIVVAMGALGGESLSDLVLTAISVAVAVIPEGLPAVVTFTLAIGAQRMLGRNALIRKLPAVETLGSVTVICSDKTGTLTQNRMTVLTLDVAGATHRLDQVDLGGASGMSPAAQLSLVAGVLCNDGAARVGDAGDLVTVGDPTETALLDAAHRAGIDIAGLREAVPRVAERPFDSERKRMSTVHAALGKDRQSALRSLPAGEPVVFVKGAVDGLMAHTAAVWDGEGAVALTEAWRSRVLAANDEMARRGMRVLGVAYRTLPDIVNVEAAEDDLTLVGLVGIIDPARPEVVAAIATCRAAGIRPIMITGDHPLTAAAIAAEIGISTDGGVLTGADLDRLSSEEFSRAVLETSVFARVSPEHKLRLVEALQGHQAVVAMTGDGVNDAPALKKADIGVAMGITGTDVSKEASDMVLRDDNFTTIVAAVEEGRVIYDNLRRFVKFAVAGNLGKILVMIGWPVPFLVAGGEIEHPVALLPLQLLWLNLMTDGLLGLSLGMEPAELGVMRRPPHAPRASIWAGGLARQALWVGGLIGVVALSLGLVFESAGRESWQTVMFTSLAFLQVFQAIGTRSTNQSLRSIGLGSNRLMIGVVLSVVALQLVAIYSPLNGFLDLVALSTVELGICVGVGVALLVVIETEKWRRRSKSNAAALPASGVGRRI